MGLIHDVAQLKPSSLKQESIELKGQLQDAENRGDKDATSGSDLVSTQDSISYKTQSELSGLEHWDQSRGRALSTRIEQPDQQEYPKSTTSTDTSLSRPKPGSRRNESLRSTGSRESGSYYERSLLPYLGFALQWVAGTLGTAMRILQMPIAVILALWIMLVIWRYSSKETFDSFIYPLPFRPRINFCDGSAPQPDRHEDNSARNLAAAAGLKYVQQLEDLQSFGAESPPPAYSIGVTEDAILKVMIDLAALDPAMRYVYSYKITPLLQSY
jgi:hypothetical protein